MPEKLFSTAPKKKAVKVAAVAKRAVVRKRDPWLLNDRCVAGSRERWIPNVSDDWLRGR